MSLQFEGKHLHDFTFIQRRRHLSRWKIVASCKLARDGFDQLLQL